MSTLKTDNISNVAGSATTGVLNVINGSATAWVNFNGTGTVAIRASHNVSSITDNGVGNYNANFATALPNANYAVCVTGQPNLSDSDMRAHALLSLTTAPTASSVRVVSGYAHTTGNVDQAYLSVAIFD